LFLSCNDSGKVKNLTKEQIKEVHQFVGNLNSALKNFEFDFIKNAWNHTLFKKRIGKLGNIGHGVFNHVYETTVKGNVENHNLDLINRVKHSGATLKHIKTNIIDTYAEITYILIEDGYYHLTRYRVDFHEGKPYLTDIYGYKDDQWFSKSMRDVVLLNTKYTSFSPKRHEANRALVNYRNAIDSGDFEQALLSLDQIPPSLQITNEFKIAKINTAANISDSLLLKTIEEVDNPQNGNNIYVDYLMALYLNDSLYQDDVNIRMRMEIGIPKPLLDSLNTENLIWN